MASVLMAGMLMPMPVAYAVDPEPGTGRLADTWSGELAGSRAGEGRLRPGRVPVAPPPLSLLEPAEETVPEASPAAPEPTPTSPPTQSALPPSPARSSPFVSAIGSGQSVTEPPGTGIHVLALGIGLALVGLGLAFLGVRLRRD
ncbi:hypothetical protein [Streptomyces sp. NPDC051219]|uniref:hypothetical protein n=1 Tax=Streptomyces sp. NPDC051219 TaxID=3155283 RepID=UPI003433F7DA